MNRGLVVLILMVLSALSASAQVDTITAPVDTLAAPAAQPAPAVDLIAAVRGLEEKRQAALVSADTEMLAEIMVEDATFAHSNGLMQTRAELFAMLERGEIRYLSVTPEDARYRVYGNTVIGTGVQSVNVKSAGKSMTLRNRFTVVYAPTNAGLRMVAYQSTPMPKLNTRPR